MSDKELRDKILGCTEMPWQELRLPEWDCTIRVYGMRGADRARLETWYQAHGGKANLEQWRARIVAMCARDLEGNALFSEEHIEGLNALAASALDRIADCGLQLSGMAPNAINDAKKNSGVDPNAASGTA